MVSYVEKPTDGSESFYPLGEQPQGIIIYTPDGYIVGPTRTSRAPPFASGDWFRGTPKEIMEEAVGYVAYSGPYHTDEEKQHLTHSMFVSLFPNWIGQRQPRVVKIEGDLLHLSPAAPIRSGGKETLSYLTWKRAEPNT